MATHSSILAWEIPRTEKFGGLQPMRSQKNRTQLSNITTNAKIMLKMNIFKSSYHLFELLSHFTTLFHSS